MSALASKPSGTMAVVRAMEMPAGAESAAVTLVQEVMKHCGSDRHTCIAGAIKKRFDDKLGANWHCIVGKDFGSFISHKRNHFIYIQMNELIVLLFKAKPSVNFVADQDKASKSVSKISLETGSSSSNQRSTPEAILTTEKTSSNQTCLIQTSSSSSALDGDIELKNQYKIPHISKVILKTARPSIVQETKNISENEGIGKIKSDSSGNNSSSGQSSSSLSIGSEPEVRREGTKNSESVNSTSSGFPNSLPSLKGNESVTPSPSAVIGSFGCPSVPLLSDNSDKVSSKESNANIAKTCDSVKLLHKRVNKKNKKPKKDRKDETEEQRKERKARKKLKKAEKKKNAEEAEAQKAKSQFMKNQVEAWKNEKDKEENSEKKNKTKKR